MIDLKVLVKALDLLPVSSKDPQRASIRGVRIESKAGIVTLVATDGHKLAEATLEAACPEGVFLVTKAHRLPLKAILKDHKNEFQAEASLSDDGTLTVGATLGTQARISPPGQAYPDYKQVFPIHRFETSITLNAEYLFEVMNAMIGKSGRMPVVRLTFDPTDSMRAVLVTSDYATASSKGVVMPCRDDDSKRIAAEMKERLVTENAVTA